MLRFTTSCVKILTVNSIYTMAISSESNWRPTPRIVEKVVGIPGDRVDSDGARMILAATVAFTSGNYNLYKSIDGQGLENRLAPPVPSRSSIIVSPDIVILPGVSLAEY